jgi:hypothetical protein
MQAALRSRIMASIFRFIRASCHLKYEMAVRLNRSELSTAATVNPFHAERFISLH